MPACCWYGKDTCCTIDQGYTPQIFNVSTQLYNNITDNGQYSSFEINRW